MNDRKQLLAQKMRSGIFQTLQSDNVTSLIIHPGTIKTYDARQNLDRFYYKQYKLKADYSSRIDCIPGSMNQHDDGKINQGKKRSKSSNAIENTNTIFPKDNDYKKEQDAPLSTYNHKNNSVFTYSRKGVN